ncbi:WxL domain-containing protein [Schleiferilactobacillus perolens]|uniref:WxL domain-containing protein n=1 Tax=Schleiferilactobacillus perolens DSM 12744 TaxID=1423792 RepID=A0A0R1MV33_9LACO|nr:WxL domain-containing protein [Schleiferilactobacillus perolens]KRL11951.1 hypothetical protein FD09_GL000560 [Schleiferilactobacillus perolens DSM 12744]
MKKSWARLLSISALALLAFPMAVETSTIQADDSPTYKVGEPLFGDNYATVVGSAVDDANPNVSGGSVLGVGFVPGPLTLNQVPIFDFGIHQLGSSSKYSLQEITSADNLPAMLPDNHGGDDTAKGGNRSLVVTDTRQAQGSADGYTVSLTFGPLIKVESTTSVDADGNAIITPNIVDGNFVPDPSGAKITDAHLEFSNAKVSDGADWNTFLAGSADTKYFSGGTGIYPAFYNAADFDARKPITTSDNRLKDDTKASFQMGQNISQDGNGIDIFGASKTEGYATWAYDFTNSTSAYLAMPTQNGGIWVATLTWTLTSDPATLPNG